MKLVMEVFMCTVTQHKFCQCKNSCYLEEALEATFLCSLYLPLVHFNIPHHFHPLCYFRLAVMRFRFQLVVVKLCAA